MSKLIRVDTLNMYSLLYANDTSIKLLKHNKALYPSLLYCLALLLINRCFKLKMKKKHSIRK